MVDRPADETKSLEASGGDDTHTVTVAGGYGQMSVQAEVTGDTTDADVHIDARLASDANWVTDHVIPAETGKAADYIDAWPIDAEDIEELRIRVVNQDGGNTASSRVIVTQAS